MVSIQLVSPASGDIVADNQIIKPLGKVITIGSETEPIRFHSISFPSEWGQEICQLFSTAYDFRVSIQLVSPASGDNTGSSYRIYTM